MELKRVTPNKEKARSILRTIRLIEKRIGLQDRKEMSALILTDYYEIVKELTTALLLLDGYKSLSHKDLLTYLSEKRSDLTRHEQTILDDMRILRNRILYDGLTLEPAYLKRNEGQYQQIVRKLKGLVRRRLEGSKPSAADKTLGFFTLKRK